MGNLVNLRMARKRRERTDKAAEAAENRARHGRTGAQKKVERTRAEALKRHIEAHRLQPSGSDGTNGRDET